MALMTGEQYIESIKKINMQVYMFGKKIEDPTEDPILRPSLNSVRMTYDLAQMPEYQDLMTVVSPYTGERINRFTHIHQSTEDLRMTHMQKYGVDIVFLSNEGEVPLTATVRERVAEVWDCEAGVRVPHSGDTLTVELAPRKSVHLILA